MGAYKLGGLSEGEIKGRVEALMWERLLGNREVIGRWQEVSIFPFHTHSRPMFAFPKRHLH